MGSIVSSKGTVQSGARGGEAVKRIVVTLVGVGLLAASLGTAEATGASASGRPSTVKITFRVDLGGSGPASRQCSLEVVRGSNGVVVLQAAVDQGCIHSYRISDSRYPPPGPWGSGWEPSPKWRHWLRCIDAICDVAAAPGTGVPGTGWLVVWNAGGSQRYWEGGLEKYGASHGDAFVSDLRAYS